MNNTMSGLKRTHYCGTITQAHVGQEIVVAGWCARQRDLGNLIFIDLRDRTGILQLAFDDKTDRAIFEQAFAVRSEFVLMAQGTVRVRQSPNPELPTGLYELFVTDLRVLTKSQTPPFEIVDDVNAKEELRLKYRYLDLRRADMQHTIMMRHRITKAVRDYYDKHGFLEIETPILVGSTPEGARDYLVPSRVHPGSFYALPQSPQQYKQMLMLSGFDRYMQIARCFRDEDLRADRQPEFTQIDVEMSFVDEEDVMSVNEGMVVHVMKEVLGIDVPTPFKRMPYSEAMDRFGSDKPDLRFGFELVNLSDLLAATDFKVFAGAIEAGGSVRAIRIDGGAAQLSRKEIDRLAEWVKTYRAKGLAYSRLHEGNVSSSFEKFLSEAESKAIRERMGLADGDVLFVVADADDDVVFASLGALRCEVAKRLGRIDPDEYNFLWVTDFPLFEYDKETDSYAAKHHPFTSPKLEDIPLLKTDRAAARARAYDMVMNGTELGGGSIRINDPDIQSAMFEALGFTPEDAQRQFGYLIDAFKYGAPPHGGIAFGLDRLVMLMLGTDSIRDVIAFPKVQTAAELMTGCPSTVDQKQLDELHIKLVD